MARNPGFGVRRARVASPENTMDSVNVRNLEQIQETDGAVRVNRLTTVFLASLGGAALVIAAVMTMQRSEPPKTSTEDPLAALVAQAKQDEAGGLTQVDRADVSFPGVLSDTREPTTALVAVKDARGRLIDDEDWSVWVLGEITDSHSGQG